MNRLVSRWLVIAAAALLLLGVVALVAVRVYLGTDGARQMIVEQLEEKLGGKVEIDSLEVSTFGSSRVRGVRVAVGDEAEPFLTIDAVDADLSAMTLLVGRRMPRNLDADGVHILLRFDGAGDLLTKLPRLGGGGPSPNVRLRGGRLTLRQDGRPALVVHGIDLAMTSAANDNLSGHVDDPVFGKLAVTGHAGDALELMLRGTTPAITPAMLRDLPFVPRAVWKQIEAEGTDVPLELDFTFQKADPPVRYRVAAERARVRLLQPDRPAMEVFPAKAVMGGEGSEFHLDGTINDPYWGDWAVRVRDPADGETSIDLDTPSTSVDQKKLVALPYVPKHVWDEVRAAGKTGVKVAVRLPAKGEVKYRVDLDVASADVTVVAIALEATKATGRVVVEDHFVKLDKVSGITSGGRIATSGELDFKKEPSRMVFDVDVKGLDLKKLPAKWELPRQIEGKLSGKANVIVTLHETGKPDLRGKGEAQIDEAKIAGFATARPIKLSLQGDGKRFKFFQPASLLSSFLVGVLLPVPVDLPVAARADAMDEAVGRGLGEVAVAARRIADGSVEGLRRLAGVEKIFRSKEVQYLDANVKLEDVDLAQLAKRLELSLPIQLEGRLNLDIKLGVPINNANSLRDYRLNGSASSPRLVIAGLEMRDAKAKIDYAKGLLRVGELSGKVVHDKESGSFAGTATMQVVPRGDLTVEGKLDQLPAAAVARVVPALDGKLAGRVSGQGKARVAVDRLNDSAAWGGTVQMSSPDLQVFGAKLQALSFGAILADGKVSLSDAKADVYKGTLAASGKLDLGGDSTYEANIRLVGADLAELGRQLPPGLGLKGTGDLTGTIRGTIRPAKFTGGGTIATRGVQVGKFAVGDVGADWSLDGDTLHLSKIAGYKGAASGSASVQLGTSKGNVKLHLDKLDASLLSKAIEGVPVKLSGQVTADADIRFEPAGGKTKITGEVDLSASTLRLQNIATRKLTGKLEWKGDAIDYRLSGEALGGKFSVDGVYPPPAKSPAGTPHGHLKIERVYLSRLVRALRLPDTWRHLKGAVSLSLPYRFDGPGMVPVGRGQFEARDIRWRDHELVDQFRAEVRLGRNGLSVREIDTTFAGGQLRISARYNFTRPATGWFDVQLSGADTNALLVLLGGPKRQFRGGLDLNIRGEINDDWRGTATIGLSSGQVSGVSVHGLRVPLDFTFSPSLGHLEVRASEGTAQFGQGRAQLRGSLRVGETTSVEGNLILFDAEISGLAGLVGSATHYLKGRVSGRVDFGGTDMRSLDDLNATVRATLRDTQALQLPVLSALTPFVLPGQSARTFRSGQLSGRLSRGVFRIAGLTLDSDVAQLLILGSFTVQGRLDLDVTAQTTFLRTGASLTLLPSLARALPAFGPVPVTLALRVTDALSSAIVHLRVTGTFAEPVVRVEPLRILSDEAVRFFLGQTTRAAP
jgi:hypothetical protein